MTRQEAQKLAPVIAAYAEGKQIQVFDRELDIEWHDITSPDFSTELEYRVKPEPVYMPFRAEDHNQFKDRWIRKKDSGNLMRISGVYRTYIAIAHHKTNYGFVDMLNEWVFEDGTPFGKLIN